MYTYTENYNLSSMLNPNFFFINDLQIQILIFGIYKYAYGPYFKLFRFLNHLYYRYKLLFFK